jgi:arabinofuranosyltransferase
VKETPSPGAVWKAGLAAALAWGLYHAIAWRWMCDDAYIGLRYAKNLADGLGLVYNAGERVEGFTALAWVVWQALSFRLNVSPEIWSHVSGIACYAGALLLLAWSPLRLRQRLQLDGSALPVAALIAGLHHDWNIYATSGIETSTYTFLLVAGYVATVRLGRVPRSAALPALLFALAALTRSDGVLPAFLAGLWILAFARPRLKTAIIFGGVFLLIWGPVQLWRISYYGDFFPNTYYTKSAMLPWWDQGLVYVRLYFQKYWVFLLTVPALAVAVWRMERMEPHRRGRYRESWLPEVLLSGAIALTYTLYVARVGGDFMYARMLIPATPFYALLVELGIIGVQGWRSRWSLGLWTAFSLWALLRTPHPEREAGIGNEWAFYYGSREHFGNVRGRTLKRFFDGVPVRILICGAEARMAYRSDAAYVLEGGGLTDPFVARQPLDERGWVGHEKFAPIAWAIEQRRIHFAFREHYLRKIQIEEFVPLVEIRLGMVQGFVLRWDAPLMAELKRRGAVFPDYPAEIDHYVENAFHCPADEIAADFARFRRFYFDDNPDPKREALFNELIGRVGGSEPPASTNREP